MHTANGSLNMEVMSDFVCSEAARSLSFLKKIDLTIDVLTMVTTRLAAFIKPLSGFRESLLDEHGVIEEDQLIPALEVAQHELGSLCRHLQDGAITRKMPGLRHDDGVVEAVEEAIETLVAVSEELEMTRWSILEHNADCEKDHRAHELSSDADVDSFFDNL